VRLWDWATGREVRRLGDPKIPVDGFAFSPDGKTLATGEEKLIRLYDTDTGSEVRTLQGDWIIAPALVFSPDGKALAVGADSALYCWEGATRRILPLASRPGHRRALYAVSFSADGKTLMAALTDSEEKIIFQRWDWPAGTERRRLEVMDSDPFNLTFSPDGKVLAAGTRGSVRLYDPATGKEVRWWEGPQTDLSCLAFSPDGSFLAGAAGDNAILLWELRPREARLPPLGLGHRLPRVALTPAGRRLITCALDGTLALWDAGTGRPLRTLDQWGGVPYGLTAAADGKFLLSTICMGDWRYGLWDLATGQRLPLPKDMTNSCGASLSPDGAVVAVLVEGGLDPIRLWDVATGREVGRLQMEQPFFLDHPAWSADGRTLAGIHPRSAAIGLWDRDTGRQRRRFPRENDWKKEGFNDGADALAISPDGRLLAAAWRIEGVILLYEAAGGKALRRLRGPLPVGALAFAPDGRTLASGGGQSLGPFGHRYPVSFGNADSAVQLWDVATGKLLHKLPGHQGQVHTLAFTPDGSLLVSGADDDTVLAWEVGAVTGRRGPVADLSPERLAALWADLAADNPARAQQAVAELTAAPAAVPFLAKALAREWTLPGDIAGLLADLDAAAFARRERAAKELEKAGEAVMPALRRALEAKPSPEARRRLADLLERLDQPEPSPRQLRLTRALQALESAGTAEARRALPDLVRGATDTPLAEEAGASLRRLRLRPTPER
jgi:WD40 repeat protein